MLSYDEGRVTDCPERAAITSVSPALITLTRIERAQGPGGGKVLPHRQRVCLPIRDGRSYLAALARRNGQGLGLLRNSSNSRGARALSDYEEAEIKKSGTMAGLDARG